MGVNPLRAPVEMSIAVWPWGKYLGDEALEQGRRRLRLLLAPRRSQDILPGVAKATGNYLNAQLIKMEAVDQRLRRGHRPGRPAATSARARARTSSWCSDGVLFTPPLAASLLAGITRDTVVKLAADLGIEVREQMIPRGLLYTCDEMFFTGTAAEITPIRSVDRIPVGNGRPGRGHPAADRTSS